MDRKLKHIHLQNPLPQEQFVPPLHQFNIVDVQLNQPGAPIFSTWKSIPSNLIRDLSGPVDNQADTPSLRVVEVHRNSNNQNSIAMSSFHDLLNHFHIGEETRVLLKYNVLGFHHFPRQDDDSGEYSCYFNNVPYIFLWSFDPKNQWTRGIFLCSDESNHSNFDHFRNTLKMNSQLVEDPMFLPITMALLTIHDVHRRVHSMRMKVRGIEATFGFSTWTSQTTARHNVGIDGIDAQQLTMYTKSISAALVDIGDTNRRLRLIELFLGNLQDEEFVLIKTDNDESTVGRWQKIRQQLVRQVRYAEIQNDYLENRAKNQFTVLFNLTNQKDATTNIDIAARTKEDSSAMKTIAIMTMIFLPGTFLAALFAVPSLQWTVDRVMTSRFWVYWAFTIPMTLAVLAIWAAITMRQEIMDYVNWLWNRILTNKKDMPK